MAKYRCPECHKVLEREYTTPTAPGWCEETAKNVLLERVNDGHQD